jgi:hypothetical protein
MKTFFVAFLCCFFTATSFSQANYFVVTGKVVSADTKQPLQAASVFAQNTTIGTATDAEGNFKIYLPEGGHSIAVTFTGYNTESKRVSNSDPNDRTLYFELSQKEKQMEEVAIVATSEVKDGWEKYGKFFVDRFIGQGNNGNASKIKNPETLKFYFSKKRNRLKVLAAEPLQIENNALGYNIKYELDSFTYEYNTETSVYTGYPLFEEMTPADSVQQLQWKLAREKAYAGSVLHFMRSVYHKTLQKEGFEIQFLVKNNDRDTALRLKDAYRSLNYAKDDSSLLVEIKPIQKRLGVIFLKEKPSELYSSLYDDEPKEFQFSMLGFPANETIGIEQNGFYFDQNDLTTDAYWSWEKLADMLPYNYGSAPPPPMSISVPAPVAADTTQPVMPVTVPPTQ